MKIAQINALNSNDPIVSTDLMVQSNDGNRQTAKGIVTNYTLCDDTGASIKAGMFGNESANFQSGQNLSIRSQLNASGAPKGVLVNEYKGTKSITVFDNAIVSPTAGGAAPQAQADTGFQSPPTPFQPPAPAYQAPPQAPAAGGDQASLDEMAQIWARAYHAYKSALVASGLNPAEAAEAAKGAPGFAAQFWFGKDRSKIQGL